MADQGIASGAGGSGPRADGGSGPAAPAAAGSGGVVGPGDAGAAARTSSRRGSGELGRLPGRLSFGSGLFAAAMENESKAMASDGGAVGGGSRAQRMPATAAGRGVRPSALPDAKLLPDGGRNSLTPPRIHKTNSSSSRVGDAARGVGVGQGSGAVEVGSFPEFNMAPSRSQVRLYESDVEGQLLSLLHTPRQRSGSFSLSPRKRRETVDLAAAIPLIAEGASAVLDDSFTHCFESHPPAPWNWNVYLFPFWLAGVIIRYFVLFPLRLLGLVLGWLGFFVALAVVKVFVRDRNTRMGIEQGLVKFLCSVFVMSWSGVIRFHNQRPVTLAGQPAGVFVANHSSMIDFIVLQQTNSYAVVGQKHTGWVGLIQDHILSSLECIWFNRGETKNRKMVAQKLKEHAHDRTRPPLLVFPEGTCVNNRFVMQFKKGVFELDVPVHPIAIKYNNVFVDAYWNSRKQSFQMHLFQLMTSWAVVCDVWYLETQTRQPGESPSDFAKRVKDMIADTSGMKSVEWDGYMKYWAPSKRFIQARQAAFSATLRAQAADNESQAMRGRPVHPGRLPPDTRIRRRHTTN